MPHISIAFSFIKSQFLYKATPTAIIAVIASIAIPIGLVKNAIAAPNAVVTVVAITHTAFHATVAAVIAICAVVSAIFSPLFITN